jgi:hypothetical protein
MDVTTRTSGVNMAGSSTQGIKTVHAGFEAAGQHIGLLQDR